MLTVLSNYVEVEGQTYFRVHRPCGAKGPRGLRPKEIREMGFDPSAKALRTPARKVLRTYIWTGASSRNPSPYKGTGNTIFRTLSIMDCGAMDEAAHHQLYSCNFSFIFTLSNFFETTER